MVNLIQTTAFFRADVASFFQRAGSNQEIDRRQRIVAAVHQAVMQIFAFENRPLGGRTNNSSVSDGERKR